MKKLYRRPTLRQIHLSPTQFFCGSNDWNLQQEEVADPTEIYAKPAPVSTGSAWD